MLLTIAGLIFVVIFLFLYVFLLSGGEQPAGEAKQYVDAELGKPLYQRLFQPTAKSLGVLLEKLTPKATKSMFEEKIAAAGGFHGLGTGEFLAVWTCVALLVAAGSGFVGDKMFHLPFNKVVGIGLLGLAIGLTLPFIILTRRIAKRKAQMQKVLPGLLDLMCVSVQAGLGFDGALAKVAEKMKGPLVEEFVRMLQEIRVGVSRRTALKGLSDRCDVPDVSLFTASLIQADQLGVSIAKVLQVQAESARQKRRLTIREAAMKAPVKLIFPLVLFIFPAIFIVLLGPAVISLMRTMTK